MLKKKYILIAVAFVLVEITGFILHRNVFTKIAKDEIQAATSASSVIPTATPTPLPSSTPTPTIYVVPTVYSQPTSANYSSEWSAPASATAQCADGTYSFSQHTRGTCSHHGGVSQWL